MPAPRPAFVTTVPAFGGAEQNLLRLLPHLRQLGVRPAAALAPDGDLIERFGDAGLRVHRLHLHRWEWRAPWRYAQTLGECGAAMVARRANLLHINHEYGLEFTVAAARLWRRPSVACVRGVLRKGWPANAITWLSKATAVVAVSGATRDTLVASGLAAQHVTVIYDGVDPVPAGPRAGRRELRATLGVPDGGVLIGSIGRLDPVKGIPFLLDAVARLSQQMPGLRCAVVGTGQADYVDGIRVQARALGVGDRVILTGFRTDIDAVLDALDVCVMPTHDPDGSWEEACPNVVLEAMAARTLLVATRSGGTVELLSGERGILVDSGSGEALADGLKTALTMAADARRAMIERAADAVRREYSLGAQAGHFAGLYARVLSR